MSVFHRNIRHIFFIVIVLSVWGVKVDSTYGDSGFVPPQGKSLVIIGQDVGEFDNYVTSVGPIPGGCMTYTSIQSMDGIYSPVDYGGGVQYAQHYVNNYPNTVMQVGLWMVGGLDETTAGLYNANIDKFGEWAKNANRPIYFRIGYEFDCPPNNYEPQKYIQAYRHIVDRLKSNGVDNVAYVWHSYAQTIDRPLMDWYPGDEYVDWCAVTFFGQVNEYMNTMAELADEHGKPLMIAESAPIGVGTLQGELSWDKWFQAYFDFIKEKDIKAFSYINRDWELYPRTKGKGWGNSRIQDNDFVKQKWLEELSKLKYLQSSDTLYADLGYQPIPEPSTFLLMGSGLFILHGLLKRSKLEKH